MSGTEPHDIVPDGFDLDQRKREWSSTDTDERRHCPACHAMSIVSRAEGMESHGCDAAYHCTKCHHDFDEPIAHADATEWQGAGQ